MLCDKCHSIDFEASPLFPNRTPQYYVGDEDDEEGPEYYAYLHQPTLDALFHSSNLGCHLCYQIRQGLFHIRGHESDEARHNGAVEIRHYKADKQIAVYPKSLQVVAKTPMRHVKVPFDLVQYSRKSSHTAKIIRSDLPAAFLADLLKEKATNNNPSIGCEENFKLASIWLQTCLTNHALCTISTPPNPPLPSRVLDVEAPDSPSGVALCSSKGRHGPYVSLSHVWGRSQIITTTNATLHERIISISIEDLSETFHDAVVLTRHMSIRYLWIDSLCIIQDNAEDWRAESSKMGEYYMNAVFNVAAVSSSDGSGGCFMTRDILPLTPCPILIRFPEEIPKSSTQVFIRPSIDWDPVTEISGFQRPPLWQRAWVVQERLLSARTLQFSSTQMSWKCRVSEASERLPEMGKLLNGNQGNNILEETLVGLNQFNAKFQVAPIAAIGKNCELLRLYDAWYDLVTLYGKCFLTQPSDIFPAISGIAKGIALAINDRYISGIWLHDLHRGLLWSAPDSTVSKTDLRHIRAPSWSWAAVAGTCNFYVRQISQKMAEVETEMFVFEGIGERTSGTDNFGGFGSVEEVVLCVRGKLKKAYPRGLEDEDIFNRIRKGSETLFDLGEKKDVGFYFADNADRKYLTEIWCVPIMTEKRDFISRENVERVPRPVEARCLALLRLVGDREVYMRVGSAWITDYSWFEGVEISSFAII
jgi:hypothetical protein